MKRIVQRHRQHNDYQIILLDWKLPDMDGLQIAREIRRSFGSEIPILLISAYDWTEFEEEAREAGISGFISKPLFKSTLFYGLRQYMGLEATHQPASSHSAGLSGSRVLLAEDNELNWEIASELLSDLGVELEWAEDGQICLDKFRESPEGYYDFILIVPFPVSWTVKMKKKQKETQDILSYHTQAAGCSDKARAKASGGRQPIEECGRTGL